MRTLLEDPAIFGPLRFDDVAASFEILESNAQVERIWSVMRINPPGYPLAFELVPGELQLSVDPLMFGTARLCLHKPGDGCLPFVFDYCTHRLAIAAAFRQVVASDYEPGGWCRASRLCCYAQEVRPDVCGRGEQCRFHGWRPEWDRPR